MSVNILKHEGDVWRTADFLRGAGIKESDFPKFMMPYFALIMIEGRLIRESLKIKENHSNLEIDDFIELFKEEGLGYNEFVIREDKTLKDICKNDKTFDVDFHAYLKSFDGETRHLLGVDKGTEDEKFLDISGVSGQLKKKRILIETVIGKALKKTSKTIQPSVLSPCLPSATGSFCSPSIFCTN